VNSNPMTEGRVNVREVVVGTVAVVAVVSGCVVSKWVARIVLGMVPVAVAVDSSRGGMAVVV
jgi:hypothetical protein